MAQLFLLLVLFSSLGENSTNSTSSPETKIIIVPWSTKRDPMAQTKPQHREARKE